MIKKLMLVAGLLCFTLAVSAQEETPTSKWKIGGISGLNLSQTSLTNWSAGGENSATWNLYFNASANYKGEKWNWDNTLNTDLEKHLLLATSGLRAWIRLT